MADDASCHLSSYLNACVYLAPLRRYGVTIRLQGSTSYRWSIVTMLYHTVMEIWPFEVLPGRLFQERKSIVGRSSVLH